MGKVKIIEVIKRGKIADEQRIDWMIAEETYSERYLAKQTVKELKSIAKARYFSGYDIKCYSKMRKAELIDVLRREYW